MSRRILVTLAALWCGTVFTFADPLSKKFDVDFFREVPSRNLKGLATRSDGRLVAGPTLAELVAPAPADLLWCLEATPDPTKFLVGTGPDGRILELTFNSANTTYSSRELAKLEDPQVFALERLSDGSILAGTSPKGALYLIRDGKPVSRVQLPVDSVFDLLAVDANTVLVATGNPGRIYRLDVKKFATVGLVADKITDTKILADRGVTLFGEIRDRNVRRLAAFADGRIVAGSAPKGNLYTFPASGGSPVILQENRDAEVTDILTQPNGDVYATFVFAATLVEARITPATSRLPPTPKESRDDTDVPKPSITPTEKFAGRSTLLWFPANSFPETLASRNNAAFYRIMRYGDLLIVPGGEAGELLGYDLKARLSLTFPGSSSSQLNAIVPLAGAAGKFLILRNNAPGLALLDFDAPGLREAETRRIELGTPSLVGAWRFNRLRGIDGSVLTMETRVNQGSDEIEGWGPWTPLKLEADGGWRAANLRGRSAKLRIKLPQTSTAAAKSPIELDRAAVYALPQNHRPQLQDFRVLSPGYGLLVSVDQPPSPVVSLSQLLQPPSSRDDDKHKNGFPSSQIVPQPGTQVVLWTVNDPDGDNVTSTFSIRRDGEENWVDLVTSSREGYAQFDTAHLPDGIYFTRLVATETAPRLPADRLSQTFETDDLVVDHTPPEMIEATAKKKDDTLTITVRGRDALSLLDGIELTFSNGVHETLEQPIDGVRDGREETFTLDLPIARVANATSVEVVLYDAAGNTSAKRLSW